MALSPGERLNGYEIVSLVGAGGMGEVYRARDTRLNRDVALKILPPQMAGNPTAYARFEREAQAVAALSHPNILAVHDFGRTETASYVVFELLQGASLRERLASGPLPVRRAIDYARQIADGLAAAHAKNITHRDIKPDNLFVTDDGRVKILDFGLAQTSAFDALGDGATAAQTQAPITDAGTVLGTVGYMAPEQVRGQAVDHRADLFALGATLFEMCTGKRAFKGATPADTMSAVLSSDPAEFSLSGQPAPPALERIVRRCLEKQPTERFQSARDLSFALDGLSSISGSGSGTTEPAPVAPRGWALPAAAALVALVAGAVAGRAFWPTSAPAPATQASSGPRLRAEFPSSYVSGGSTSTLIALSPDGSRLAYSDAPSGSGQWALYVRDLGTGVATLVPEGDNGFVLDWSPQGDAVLFYSPAQEMRRFRVGERTSTVVARATAFPGTLRGGTWLADGTVVFAQSGTEPLARLALTGGAVTPVVRAFDDTLAVPQRIGTRTDVVLALRGTASSRAAERQVVVIRLADGQVRNLVANEASAVVASGHLLLPRPAGLFAAPFDMEGLTITGEPVSLGDTVVWDAASGMAAIAASRAGVMALRPNRERALQFEWLDATGRSLGPVGPPGFYRSSSLSPDGSRIVVRLLPGPENPEPALRLLDLTRGVVSPVVTPAGAVSDPIWSADGTRILYRLGDALQRQSPYSTDYETVRKELLYPDAVSRDGRWMLVGGPRPGRGFAIMALAADGQGDLQSISDDGSNSDEASFSPDGRLVSYNSNRSGRAEVYVTRFPSTGERWQVSSEGGVQARWSRDGRWLYYLDLAGRMMRVAVPGADLERIGRPEIRFDAGIGSPSLLFEQYAVYGDRFLVLRPSKDSAPQTIAVVSNWTSALPRPAATPVP